MIYQNFNQLIDKAKSLKVKKRMALAGAYDAHSLQAALQAQQDHFCEPVLVGKRDLVKDTLEKLGCCADRYEIVDSGEESPGKVAVEYVRDGKADFLMKGGISSKDLLKPVVDKDNHLKTDLTMTSIALAEIPSYPKLIVNVDGGMVIYPDLEQKKHIIMNSVKFLHKLGYENPKVAVLCGVEVVNEKMVETVHAAELVKMNRSGEIGGCTVVGPISYDLIVSKESANIKGYECPFCEDFDVILCPVMAAGNMLTKTWVYNAGAKWAGIIAGAKVPIVMTSRGSTAEEKYLSIMLAALTSGDAA